MHLIELQSQNGDPVFINPEHIACITVSAGDQTIIRFAAGESSVVLVDLEELLRRLRWAKARVLRRTDNGPWSEFQDDQ